MPKMKTHSAAKKRFKVTASGRVKHKQAHKSHLLSHESSKRKRHLRAPGHYVSPAQHHQIAAMLPYGT